MEKYLLDCQGYTRECLNLLLNILEEMASVVEIENVDLIQNMAIIHFNSDRSAEKFKKLISMGDLGRLDKLR